MSAGIRRRLIPYPRVDGNLPLALTRDRDLVGVFLGGLGVSSEPKELDL